MNSSRPYILRALHEWIVDNECTPHILVDVNHPHVKVPPGYAADGQIVLNTAPAAVRYFTVDSQAISFEARFSGSPFSLYVPIAAVLAIYANENGQGMFFDAHSDAMGDDEQLEESDETGEQTPVLHAVDTASEPTSPDDEPPTPPAAGRPSLRIIK